MLSEIFLIPVVFLAVSQVKAQVIETLGELNFSCPEGWSIHKANCYMKVDVDETHKEAKAVCTRQGSDLFMLNNDIEYDEAVHKLFPTKNIWIAYKTNDTSLDFIKRWANFEPVVIPDQPGCIVLDPIASKTRVADCDERHAFVCKRRACLQGYVSCDKATKCIPMERMCDGNMDCDDTSDEFFNCSPKGYHSIHVNGPSSLNTGTLTAGNQITWNLVAPIGRRIRIFIQPTTLAANLAFLDIYSGTPYMQEASLIKRFTGTVSSQYIFSTNNFLTINMYAQNVQSAVPAFNILYTSDLPEIFHGFKDLTASISWEQLVFPYQDEMNKPAQLQLRWRITAPVGQLISYYLEKVENSSKPLQAEIMSGDWTLSMDHIYVSGTNTLEIVMKEVPSNTKLVYKTGCGQIVSRHSGTIISPNLMGMIPNNVMCSWTLDGGQRAGRGMSLKLYTNFTSDPRITPGSRSEDYITINADGNTVKNYTDRIYSSRNGLVVIDFTSDAALNSNSFRIEFATDCPALNVSSETNKSKQGAVFEEDVELSCPTGHKFHLEKYSENRSLTLTCGKDQQWYIKEEKLVAIPECRVVYCGPPPKIENGYIVKATGATYNSTTMYSCAQGFTMFENKNATCDENGKWMNAPTCDSATCEALSDDMLPGGSWSIIAGNNFTNGNADFNTVVKFSCNSGFELIGPVRTRCTDVGWTHQNTPPSCARLPCTRPVVANGNLNGTSNPVYGDTLKATCNPGFQLSNGAPNLTLTCGVNQVFDIEAICEDINECNSGLLTCHVDTTTCENTEGNFTCRCRAGFNTNNGTACTDILECDNNNGGCSHTCNEQQPDYNCSCPEGFVLFMQGGNEGFTTRSSETGNMPGDVYRVGHTCVPKQCLSLPPLANGQYLTKDTVFHYNDSVEVHCNDGYFLTGRSSTDATIECQNNRTWNETLTCQARSCDMPVPPSNGVFNVAGVSFMETVTLTCNLTETKQVSKSAVCVYISKAEGMRLAGDNLTCPEIDCGSPNAVLPNGADITQPNTTTYLSPNSTFVFACKAGASVTGKSESNDTNVKCKANGRWSLGTLSCLGMMCSDPGTPGGMTQLATSYEIGAKLSYRCTRSGFEPTGPQDYTCQYDVGSGSAVWSGNLTSNPPSCEDTEKPKVTMCPNYSSDYFYAMGTVNFMTPNFTDNYGIKSLNRAGSSLRSGDVLSPSSSQINMNFTAEDYAGNTETCSYTFNVYDKSVKPNITCPQVTTVTVTDQNGVSVNVSDWVTVTDMPHHNTRLSFSPSVVMGTVANIGTSQEVTATALFTSGPNINVDSRCKFRVHFVAGMCFKEQLFSDHNSVRSCLSNATGSLVCNSTCNSRYVYGDGATVKTFTCSGGNEWDYNFVDPANRFCLPIQSSDDTITTSVVYNFSSNNYNCTSQFASKVALTLSTFATRLSTSCDGLSWTVEHTKTTLVTSSQFGATYLLKLQVPSSDTGKKNICLQTIRTTPGLFNLINSEVNCGVSRIGTVSAKTVTAEEIVVNCRNSSHNKVFIQSLSAYVCVTCSQGYYFSSAVGNCTKCPVGQYQDSTGQNQCKQCPAGASPNSDQTKCQSTCWAGYTSTTGFYPCSVCPVDTYWLNTTHCQTCPNEGSTVGVVGATSTSQCKAPCPVGTYSSSGYMNLACIPCPRSFYQDKTGQKTCTPCSDQQSTAGNGSTASANCTAIGACNDTVHCSGHGTCSIENHRHVCYCDTGYYGDTCSSMFRICNANPCTNNGSCVQGAGPEDYTCSCPDVYDVCDMGAGTNGTTGDASAPVIGDVPILVDSVDKCKELCLNNKLCKEASYAPTSGGQRFCSLYGSSVTLVNDLTNGSAHFKKSCKTGFNGTNCEVDNVNNCATAGCQNNAACMDMVGSFKCFCPSPSITGTLCNVTSAPCDSFPCQRGNCTSHDIARYQCTCPDGYTGLQCETNINDCLTAECLHGGTCQDLVNSYVCNCMTGFTGRNCEIVGNFCQPRDCDVNNVCYSSLDKKDGLCACDPKFFDPVYICTFTSIPNTQIVGGQYKAPVKVTSLPECESLCQNDATCLYAELSGDMFCSFYNINGSLQNTTNYTVLKKDCPTSGDAYKCHRKSTPCDNSPCKNGATCSDDGFNATCACAAGFTGSLCQHNINDCKNDSCKNGGTCVDGLQTVTCTCPSGYTGSRCEIDINECPLSQCNTSQGICVDLPIGYYCSCKNGYTGRNCEVDIDECLSNPCKHMGMCQNKVNDYTCTCRAGWTGKDCSTEINYCANRTCQNALCYNLQNTSFCRCEGGASGENCENATKVCDVLSNIKVCTNTGNCTDKPGTAECKCPIDYSGVSCEFIKDWCSLTGDANPCKNGGQCSPKGPLGYMCTCKTGYSGPNCTTEANPCLTNPCGGNATCYHNVTDYICQCPEGKTLSNKQCLGDSSQHVLLVNTLYCTSPPVLQSPFRWTPGSLSVMLWVRSHNAGSSLFSIWLSSKLHPNYASGMDEYGIIVNTSGIYASNNTNWMGIRFSADFGGNLHDGKWRHLGVSISAAGKMSATIDAITYSQEVAVDPLPTSAQNGQVRLGEEYVAEYERLTVWNAILSPADFALAFGEKNEPSTGLIQGWYNYDLKFSADRMTTRLPENILAYPNLNFPTLNCGPSNFNHVSSDRIVSREIFSSIADDFKASNNQSLNFKNSLLTSMTWGYYEAIFVGIDPTTNNYGECRTQAFIKYNARCPNPVIDNSVTIGTCPRNPDAVCNVSCSMSNTEALFAPLPRYMACSSVGVWWNKKPYENLILPGCTTKGTPSYKVTSEMKFAAVINCNIVSNLDTEVGQKLQVTFSELNSTKWTDICTKKANTPANSCDNLEIINKTCETGTTVYNVKFALTFDSKTLTPFGDGAPVSVLDVLRIIILLEKDLDASFRTIASSTLQTGTVVISMTEVCGTGYALMKDDTGSICVPCGAGWFLDSQSKQCVPCEYGFYQPSTAQTMCTQCPSGKTTYSKGSKASSDCVVSCPIGKSYNATSGECMDCPRHYYQDETGKNFCKPCPIGFKTVGNGSNSNTQCKEDCPAGYTRNPGDITKCMQCPRGTYRNTQDDCQACPGSKYTMESTVAIIASNCDMDNCSLGEYWNTSTSTCTPCPIGEYQNTLYQVQCKMCNTSFSTNDTGSSDVSACIFFCPAGNEQKVSGECAPCERSFYKDNTGNNKFAMCLPCGNGNTTERTGATSQTMCSIPVCRGGQFIKNGACEACPMDSFSNDALPNSNTTCIKCTGASGLFGTKETGSNSSQCERYCPPGQELKGPSCEYCPRGYYKDNTGNSRFEDCKQCTASSGIGTTTDATGANNTDLCNVFACTAGQIHTPSGCNACPADSYQSMTNPFSYTTCSKCPKQGLLDTGTKMTASTMSSQCEAFCPSGHILNATRSGCVPCERGSYKNNAESPEARFAASCTLCTTGLTTETTASTAAGNCTIPKCAAGQYLNASKQCTNCPLDTYSSDPHPTSATTCQNCTMALLKGTTATGANSSDQCLPICGGGKYYSSANGICLPCPQGQFKEASNRFGQCQNCTDTLYTTVGTGSTANDNCTLRACDPGYKINGANCDPCPTGTFQNVSYQTFCHNCRENTNTSGTNSTSENACQIYCGAGLETNQAGNSCTQCPVNKVKAVSGVAPCTDCPTDFTSNMARTTCNIVHCAVGRQLNVAGTGCDPCPIHQFKNTSGNTTCLPCPDGVTSLTVGATACTSIYCVPGKTLVDADCQPCTIGKYKEVKGNTPCTTCPASNTNSYTTSGTGSTSTAQCDTIVCKAGQFRNSSQKSTCTSCPLNTYQPSQGATSCLNCSSEHITLKESSTLPEDCVPKCTAGQQYNESTKTCFNCPKGTYKTVRGNYDDTGKLIECLPCTENTTTLGERSISALNCTEIVCPMGTYYTLVNSKTQCVVCPVGKYNDMRNQPQCTPCPSGNTTFDTGNVYIESCIDECQIGYGYSSVSRKCVICATGEFNDKEGSNPNLCKRCPANFISTQPGSKKCLVPTNTEPSQVDVDVTIKVKYKIAIGSCDDLTVLIYIQDEIIKKIRVVLASKNAKRFGQSKGICKGISCDNLFFVKVIKCLVINQGRKRRDINSELEVEFKFENISSYVTDLADNSSVTTQDAIAQILGEAAVDNELSPVDGVIEYFGLDNVSVVELCSAGQQKVNNTCEDCPAGSYGRDGKQCTLCGPNQFQNMTRQSICQQCPSGTINTNNGSTVSTDCLPVCEPGYEFNNASKQCDRCLVGRYKIMAGNADLCVACPTGTTTTGLGSTSRDMCNETSCEPGQTLVGGQCMLCAMGTYKSTVGNVQCTTCPLGWTTPSNGSTNATQCDTKICPAGQFREASQKTTCTPCAKNSYQNAAGMTACIMCPNQMVTLNTASTSVAACVTECKAGTFYEMVSGQIKCTACPKGTYSNENMLIQCKPCAAGTSTEFTGAISPTDCTTDCAHGEGLNMTTKQCVKCPIRQYNNKTGENTNLCKICPAGKTNSKTGQPDCPLTVTSPFERKFVNIMIKLKYKLAIDDCNMSPVIVVSFRTAIGKALRDLFLFNKNNRYNGDYSFCRGDCENIIVDEDLKSCVKVSSVRRKREFDHELLFTVTFNNVSTQIPDPKDGNVELLTSDVIAQILLFNQGSLTPESQARVMQYQSNTGLTAVGICEDGTSWVDPKCVLCQAGSAGTSGNCLQCGPDTYQDAAGQTTCKPCPENTFHNDNGAASNKSCEDFCTKNPLYCDNRGRCVTTGRRTAMCNCYDDNEGDRCQSKKEPQSTLPVILGAAIGGGGGLLVLILVMVGLYKCLSTKGPRSEKRYAPEHMDYDNYGPVFYDNPVGSLGRIPAIGYPTAGHQIKETSFDHGSQNGAYQWSSHEGRAGWDMYEGQGPQTRWET